MLSEIEDYIQNAAIYEQAKSLLEKKLSLLKHEYFLSPAESRASTQDSDEVASGDKSRSASVLVEDRRVALPEGQNCQYVLHATASQPNCLPCLQDLSVEHLEAEKLKIRHVESSIFGEDAHLQVKLQPNFAAFNKQNKFIG